MPEPLVMRRAGAADRSALVALQEAAYAPNRTIIGGTPTPLKWDYDDVLARWQVFLAEDAAGPAGALILELRPDDLYIQSIAVAPRVKGRGVGNAMLDFAEAHALQLGRFRLRLCANARMRFNVDWYGRKGFAVEEIETVGDRRRVHMEKPLSVPDGAPGPETTNTTALGGA